MTRYFLRTLCVAAMLTLFALRASAQELAPPQAASLVADSWSPLDDPKMLSAAPADVPDDRWNDYRDGWHLKFLPQLWIAGVNGSVGKNNREISFDKTFSDLLDKLNGAAGLDFEVGKGPITGIFDGLFYSFKSDSQTKNGHFRADGDLELTILDFGLAYRFLNTPLGADKGPDTMRLTLEAVPGFRWTNAFAGVSIKAGPFTGHTSGSRDFFDPYIGGRIRLDLNRHINVSVLGNYGGFGVGTQATYAIDAVVEYRINSKWGVIAGYQVLYDKLSKNGFNMDVTMQGPVVGMSIRY